MNDGPDLAGGGGFGGSVIALVPDQRSEQVRESVSGAFAGRRWALPGYLDALPSAGASRLR